MDHRTRDFPSQPVRSGEDAVSCQTAEALHTGLRMNPGGTSTDVCSLELQHQRYHEKSHQPMDRGDCQGSLYVSWSRVWQVAAHEVRALSASWAYNCQVALPDILSAAFWRSSGVFQNLYLRACIADDMSTLGPVVVAQVVDPGHLHPPP